ncbi:plasmid pRiA4b ORF-3 family protein [Amycolatopsis cynarae]|uniref:Plasmid pRiA4b ORF-3 family protein n=1 Tax=Amycolatopsis cynarae TaxID=2995223 RepID=A0ABY7B6A2_9PSEU|nr:plasmid pRiA4b ORF-3 family protein [Amycolatopsis sp. HUAS 11-8]WAL66718.1 plasmid pRiA4b ORF-3 family protein [Amycolatopsis sp. HUAS 11-8]
MDSDYQYRLTFRALAAEARECEALRHASALAEWVGTGRQLTAKKVLRPPDVPEAGRVLGVAVPQRVRTAADVPSLHRAWTAAVAAGLLEVRRDRAVPGPALPGWRSAADDEVVDNWARALAAALADTFDDGGDGAGALEIGRRALTVLATDPTPVGTELPTAINWAMLNGSRTLYRTYRDSERHPAEVVLELLAAFAAVTGEGGQWRISPLGRSGLQILDSRGVELLAASGAPAGTGGVFQLKITPSRMRPACWRRVLVPASATLGKLHAIIQVVFAWNDDRLHSFQVGPRQYGNPFFNMPYNEDETTLAEVFDRGRTSISYVYGIEGNPYHDIELERLVEPDPATSYPVCVTGRGEAPVEDGPDRTPFDRAGINARLGRLESLEDARRLRDDVEVILVDAQGEAEEMTAFRTVLEEEVSFPVPATLQGASVTVVGLTEDDAALELRARCQGKDAEDTVSFADLEFRQGTVEAWLQAGYLAYLGREGGPLTRPPGWDGLYR